MTGRGELRIPIDLKREMVEVAKRFRKESTASEHLLWQHLRRKALDGHKFRRQHPFGPFVLDFFCAERRLAVEVDGPIHASQREDDIRRQNLLEDAGLTVLRLPASEVEEDINAALNKIRSALLQRS